MMQKRYLAPIALLAMTGCSIKEAQMALPVGLAAQTTRVELAGLGGWQDGSFRLGSLSGTFTRRSERLGILDPLFVKSYGAASFTVSGPDVHGELSARCGYRQKEVSVGFVSLTPRRLSYTCTFRRNGLPMAAELELRDRHGFLGSADGREAREGTLIFEGVRLTMRSIHMAAGGSLPLAAPLGYVLESDGRAIGAVDLNGTNKTLHLPVEPRLKAAAIAASLALGVFWDPAEIGESS